MKFLSWFRWFLRGKSQQKRKPETNISHLSEPSSLILDADRFYKRIYSKIEARSGVSLDPDTLTAIVGFSAGGSVSLRTVQEKRIYLTCELAMYEAQRPSADGALRFELMTEGHFPEDTARALLTALGHLSQSAVLGKGHTIDVAYVFKSAAPIVVKLELAAKFSFEKKSFGIYQVVPVN